MLGTASICTNNTPSVDTASFDTYNSTFVNKSVTCKSKNFYSFLFYTSVDTSTKKSYKWFSDEYSLSIVHDFVNYRTSSTVLIDFYTIAFK